jgi:hypothetical protein
VSGSVAPGRAKPSADPLAALSADQIARKAVADLRATSSVHVSGSLIDSGTTVGLNLTIGKTTLSLSCSGSFQVMQAGSTTWFKPDKQFLKTNGGSTEARTPLIITTAKPGSSPQQRRKKGSYFAQLSSPPATRPRGGRDLPHRRLLGR